MRSSDHCSVFWQGPCDLQSPIYKVVTSVKLTVVAVETNNQNVAQDVVMKRTTLRELMDSLLVHKAQGLGPDNASKLEISFLEKLGRV